MQIHCQFLEHFQGRVHCLEADDKQRTAIVLLHRSSFSAGTWRNI